MHKLLLKIGYIFFLITGVAHAKRFEVQKIIEKPIYKNGKLLIIVPAKKYSMRKPLFSKVAEIAKNEGYTVVRFNWGFFTDNIEPSLNFENEARELSELIKASQKELKFLPKQTIVLAKSFGGRIVAKIPPNLYNELALMTPNCDQKNSFYKTYKNLFIEEKKIQISISVDDPYCDIEQIYSSLQRFDSNVSIYTTYGDHNFNLEHNKWNQGNIALSIVNWMNSVK